MARNASPDLPGCRWATTKETAEYLGVTTRTLALMVADGRLRKYYLGSRIIRFDLNQVDAALIGGGLGGPAPNPATVNLRRGGRDGRGPMPDNRKRCSRCGEVKPVDYYGPDRRARDGLRSCCRECESADACARYQERTGSDPA
jgi:excisionase family DNA binding protein